MSVEFIVLTKKEYTLGCGMGQGATCCRFLVLGNAGVECARHTIFHEQLVASDHYVASRIPTAPYPHCQLQSCHAKA